MTDSQASEASLPREFSEGQSPIIAPDFTLHLPNIRSLFEPDDGHVFLEGDLARADACIAAWDADARELKQWVRDGYDFHSTNAVMLFGSVFEGRHGPRQVREINPRHMHVNGMSYRDCAKRWVHATHFHGGASTVAAALALDREHVEAAQRWWCNERHPEIGRWHRRIEGSLNARKMPVIHNAFGYRRVYVGGAPYGRGNGNLLGQALGWICQSTVAIVINKAIEAIDCNLDLLHRERCGRCLVCRGAPIELLLQVHDSALMQVPSASAEQPMIDAIVAAMDIKVPYDDPLHIPVELKWSDRDYGNMRKWEAALSADASAASL